MKITCQSCQSKYNVADEKVQGKIVKIRCRKCGATIVVNGAGDASANGSAASGATADGGAQWHVNVSENDQRTLTLPELVDAYNAGVVTQDTFIWTDGMDDWKPLSEVDPVVSALHAGANQMAIGTPGAFETPGAEGGYEPPAAPAYAAPAAASYEPPAPAFEAAAAAPAPEPKRAAVQKREARGRDLFSSGAGEEMQSSAPAGGDGGLTGQRNETSVLFSLAVLTKSADDRPAAPGPTGGAATKEDSGLIDLKALAVKAESLGSGGSAGADVFSAPIGMTAAPLGAPIGALGSIGPEAAPKSKLPLYIGAGGGMVVLLVLGIVLGVKLGGGGPAPTASALPATTTTTATAEPSAAPSATAATDTAPSATPSASVAAAKPKPAGGGTWKPPAGGGAAPVKPAGAAAAPGAPAAPAAAPPKKGGDCGCNGDLMCLMKCSTH